MAALKCPNPTCDFLFDPRQCPPNTTLACPRCEMRFTLEDPALAAAPAPAAERPRRFLPEVSGAVIAIGGVLTGILVVTAAVAITLMARRGPEPVVLDRAPEFVVEDKNFAFRPPAGWATDPAMMNTLRATGFAFRRQTEPSAWLALHWIDYKTRNPFPSELQAETRRLLSAGFVGVPQDLPFQPAQVGGRTADRAIFRGESRTNQAACVGEISVITHQGLAYWLLGWTAEVDAAAVAGDIESARSGFRILDGRANWTPEQITSTVFRSVQDNSVFALSTTDPAWRQADREPTDEHPAAQLVLTGVVRSPGDIPPTATTTVFVLPAESDPIKQAEAFIRARQTPEPEVFGPVAIEKLDGELRGESAPNTTPPTGPIPARLSVRSTVPGADPSADKLAVFHALKVKNQTVIVEAVCSLNERGIWERRLADLVRGLQPNN